ncbi:prolyl oligopeptidase family serine peptidase [Cellulomonas sp. S1-8]|uniref:prolyl oligopeptidase family serine peptidase n=1 Tax=Cellulomonas sp. S1-8 TaxID=2904790 RepID=UPI0022448D91|nr:PHB depolymerase family esterase [Cellulomonas sp. S1-8]UZN04337.1 prolyl oligopeptidase family serine peptidase [Cellulomonas sp. S1-8]
MAGAALAVGVMGPASPATARGVPQVVGVDVVVQVGPLGAAVTAVALEYDRSISARPGTLDETAFVVEVTLDDVTSARTVTDAYVSGSAEPGAPRRSGRFLVVALDPADANASVLAYDGELNHRIDLDGAYTVDLRDDLVDRSGRVVVPATVDALANDDVVTPVVDDFVQRSTTASSGVRLRYGLFSPDVDRAGAELVPLVVALHGAGERGTDGHVQLLANELGVAFAAPSRQQSDPSFVLVPQAPPPSVQPVGDWVGVWDVPEVQSALLELVDRTIAQHPVDPDRVYVTGLSMGSMGTFQVLAERPDLFAAALPVTGYADPRFASVFAAVPTWATHSVDDEAVPFDHPYSDWNLLTAIEATGAAVTRDEWAANLPDAENEARAQAQWDRARAEGSHTLFTAWTAGTTPVNAHFAWVPTYSNDIMVDWLYSHERG